MCVGPEDFAKVSAAQDAARTEWRDYEMSCGNYKTAMSYSVTDEEIAGVRWGSVGVCICLWREGG